MPLQRLKSFYWACRRFRARYIQFIVLMEVAVITALSLFPLFAIGAVSFVNDPQATNYALLFAPISSGQLYLYCFSTLATIFWLSVVERSQLLRILVLPVVLIVVLFVALLLGVDPQLRTLKNPIVISISYYLYTFSVVLYFIVLSFIKAPPPPVDETLASDVNSLDARVTKAMAETSEA